MGNQQGKPLSPLPPDIQARIDDLENRIKVGKFSNNKQGEKDIEGLLDYWHLNYGGKTKRTSLPSAKELINQHFNCSNILEKDKCQARGDSGCMWEPFMKNQNDEKYDPDGVDAKNQKQYEGLCLKASPMSKAEQTPRPASAVLHQLEKARKPPLLPGRGIPQSYVGVPKRIADLKFSYPGAKVGAQRQSRFNISDRKAQLYRDESQKLVKDIIQSKKGDTTKLEEERDRERKERRNIAERGETKGGRKTRKKRRKRKTKRRKQKRKTKRKRRKRKTRKKKKQKGGSCYNNTNCFFIKGHGKSNRKSFEVPANIEINFYAPKGQLAPAFYNDIRDACYDIDLKEGGPCERVNSPNMCPDYRITNFKGAKQTVESSFYAAPKAGLYNCPPFYPNAPTGYKESQLIAPISDNGTTLSEIVMYVSERFRGTNNVINCNFCRGTKGTYANQFFNSIPQDIPGTPGGTGATGRFSQQYNQNMRNQYQTNMNQQQGMDLDD